MSYLKFDKNRLVNLEYSLQREILRSNKAGSYISTSLSGCNTRKYHGLLICPLDEMGGEKHVLLSSLDETVLQHGSPFNLGIHKYDFDHFEPRGHKYMHEFELDLIPKITFRVGGVVLSKERILVENEQQVLIRYKLEDAHSATVLRFRPFLAFRSIHQLAKANLYVNTHYSEIQNGIKVRLYDGYPFLHMQFTKEAEFVPAPDWYYGVEYPAEQQRGYDYKEDLFVPGYFELPIKKGESVIFSASTSECGPEKIRRLFLRELKSRIPRDSYMGTLKNAADQFIQQQDSHTGLIAGFPWYGQLTRQTLIALPGLTLDLNDQKTFEEILDHVPSGLKNGLLPANPEDPDSSFDSVDAPLWFFWTVQQYYRKVNDAAKVWKKYGEAMKAILDAYRNGTDYNIRMLKSGLISGKAEHVALTWMNSYVGGKPVVQRAGMPVEVNALWYNAICFGLELAEKQKDHAFLKTWKDWPEKIARSFTETFWSDEKQYLADCVDGENKDWSIRPNMLIAAALEFSPIDRSKQKAVVGTVQRELLTSRGLRSLSPRDPRYVGVCRGPVRERELAAHQGTAWPWLVAFFAEAYLKVHRRSGFSFVKALAEGFEEEMTDNCIGTIPEMYDGDPPHNGGGAISQAWSVAGVIRSFNLLESYSK